MRRRHNLTLCVKNSTVTERYFVTRLIFSEREPTFTFAICYRQSVCRLSSVTFVRHTQAVKIFGNSSTALGTLAIR